MSLSDLAYAPQQPTIRGWADDIAEIESGGDGTWWNVWTSATPAQLAQASGEELTEEVGNVASVPGTLWDGLTGAAPDSPLAQIAQIALVLGAVVVLVELGPILSAVGHGLDDLVD